MNCSNNVLPKINCIARPRLMIEHDQEIVIEFFNIEKSYIDEISDNKLPKWFRGIFKTYLRKHYQIYSPIMKRLRNRYEFQISSTGNYPILKDNNED